MTTDHFRSSCALKGLDMKPALGKVSALASGFSFVMVEVMFILVAPSSLASNKQRMDYSMQSL
jgi:hypothetical protein